MAATLILGVLVTGGFVAAVFRLVRSAEPPRDRWLLVGVFVVGNLVLVLSHGVVLGTVGIVLMLGSLAGLLLLTLRSRDQRR